MSTTTPAATPAQPTVSTNGRRLIDAAGALAIFNSRKTLTTKLIGEPVTLRVASDGQFLPQGFAYDGAAGATVNAFDRTIYNLKANSQLSALRKENKQLFMSAMKAESAGDRQLAHDLFNEWLNNVQISFSVIEPSSRVFHRGDYVVCEVAEVTSKSGERQLVVNDVQAKTITAPASIKFELSDFMDSEESDDTQA